MSDNGKGNGNRQHYTPWLVIRYAAGDTGARPVPPGAAWWESPDVWTQQVNGGAINQPVAGQPSIVFTNISNLGREDANNVTLQYFWANPSIAINAGTANLIATQTVSIPANNVGQFQSPVNWVPVDVNNGHECLIVQANLPVLDPITDPFQPANDRHVGQKNEQLVLLQQGEMFHFRLDALNFTDKEADVFVEMRPGLVPRDLAQRFAGRGLWREPILDTPPLPVGIEISRDAARQIKSGGRVLSDTRNALDCLGPALVSRSQAFLPGELRRVEITGTLPVTARPGEVYVARISQRIGGAIAGGYTLYVTLDTR
ncbi:MAG TPA: hypothetical protein VKV17_14625 [Bryobacteraceae bacterium]|nr:hypothetical protein [Bryobacteraceae bacterium]